MTTTTYPATRPGFDYNPFDDERSGPHNPLDDLDVDPWEASQTARRLAEAAAAANADKLSAGKRPPPLQRIHDPKAAPKAAFADCRSANLTDIHDRLVARADLVRQYPGAGIYKTGIPELDAVVSFGPGQLFVLAGREGAGKSAFMLQIARYMAHLGPVLVLLTEMCLEEVAERIVAATGHIPLWQIQKFPTPEMIEKLSDVLKWLGDCTNLTIVEAQGKDIDYIISEVEKAVAVEDYRLVVIDNLWGVTTTSLGSGGTTASGVSLTMGRIAQRLAQLAANTGGMPFPIILVHHLNRDGVGSKAGTATLGGSDHIGNWASVVGLISNADSEGPFDDSPGGPIDGSRKVLRITKNRHGPPNVEIELDFIGEQQRFVGATPAQPFARPAPVDVKLDREFQQKLANMPSV